MSLYDRLVPAEALRFDRHRPMTAGWSFAYDSAGAFYLERHPFATGGLIPKGGPVFLRPDDFPLIRPEAWERASDPLMPPGVAEIDGNKYPLIEFTTSDDEDRP